MQFEKVLYVPGQTWLVDFLTPNGLCSVTGEPAAIVKAEYPGAIEMSYPEAAQLIDKQVKRQYLTGPHKITKARFFEMLGVLPPVRWTRNKNNESFMLSELQIYNIASFYVRIGKKYYTINAHANTSHENIVKMVKEGLK